MIRSGSDYHPAGPIRIAMTFRERTPDEWSFLQDNELGVKFNDDKTKCQELTGEITAKPGPSNPRPEWQIFIPGVDTSHLKNDPAILDWIRSMNPVFRIRGGMLTGSIASEYTSSPVPRTDNGTADKHVNDIRQYYESLLSGTTLDIHAELKAGYQAALNYLEDASAFFKPEGFREQDLIREILGKRARFRDDLPGKQLQLHHGSAAEMIGMLLFTSAMLQSGTMSADPTSEPVFIIEDPEANLHPMTLEAIRLLIERLKWQKIITTQSGDFLAGFPISQIRRITRNNGVIRQFRTDPGSLSSEDLRRLSYHIRMKRGAATFARCWLLVEGETEVWLLPHIARLSGFELAMEGIACVEFAQCGIAPLIKTARQLGIEWHLLADGDAAGKAYIETAKHFASMDNDDPGLRCTRFREKDIENHLFFNGYAGVYQEYSGIPKDIVQRMQPYKVIGRAIHRNSKPFMAIAIVEAMAREGSPGVPPVLKNMIQICVNLASGKHYHE